MLLSPLKFHPIFKERVWGGRDLESVLGKKLPSGPPIGESWEISDRPGDVTVVAEGPFAGETLAGLRERFGEKLLGKCVGNVERFPLLVKFVDAHEWLSVQVHPDDATAAELQENDPGKTEAWYVVHAEPGARLVCRLKDNISSESLAELILHEEVESALAEQEVKPGSVIFLPAGTVHALGKGILVAEIQQNSDLTYRLYDWGRVGLDGKPRELHIGKAQKAIRRGITVQGQVGEMRPALREGISRLVKCPYFVVEEVKCSGSVSLNTNENSFNILMGLDGSSTIEWGEGTISFTKGEVPLIPAGLGRYSVKGDILFLRIFVA